MEAGEGCAADEVVDAVAEFWGGVNWDIVEEGEAARVVEGRKGTSMLTVEKGHHFVVLEQTRLFRAWFAEVAY